MTGMFTTTHSAGEIYELDSGVSAEDFDAILRWAKNRKASDITIMSEDHVWAQMGGKWFRITSRPVSATEVEMFVRSIYGDNGPGVLKSGRDLDPAYEIRNITTGERERYRLNITAGRIPNDIGFQLTFRALPSVPPVLQEEIVVEQDIVDNLRPGLGLNLVTGPTGSGKSTLLYSMLRYLMNDFNETEKVLDYSSPIEYVMDGIEYPGSFIWQTEVGTHLKNPHGKTEGDDWAYAVRNSLRRKPEIILIGEARDRATFEGCIQTCNTGHLTFSTLHTMGVPETIRRALMFFPTEERRGVAIDLLDVLNLVVTQRLEKRADGLGKIAIREYLVFDSAVKNRLIDAPIEEWPRLIRQLMNAPRQVRQVKGQSMAEGAHRLLEEGLITEDRYRIIAARQFNESSEMSITVPGQAA